MLLLDTSALPRTDRLEAFRVAMQEASVPCRVEHRPRTGGLHARMTLVPLGAASVFNTDASGFRLVRTPRHVRQESVPMVALAFQQAGRGEYAQRGHEQVVRGADLMLVDLTAPYSFGCATGGGSRSFQVPQDQLALPMDVVRRAVPRLRSSPLHGLVRAHLDQVCNRADEFAAATGAAALGTATVELVRALLVSAAGETRLSAAVREQTLVSRVRAYVAQHLTDPDLTPATIAAAHAVSVRLLYQACSEAGLSLEQHVITARLERARAALVSPAGRRRSIAATAAACGFADPSHFARRFKAAYGLTPREWQRADL
ncbi:helix-turn-helix domain-containing protein [Modestobacter versicolor]|uniref:AraC family transcriptional regulator n=1 Tax=Modestobacter versicolor TaxID=429133 RepID=A0A323VWB2_9ACTN|nr:helix-turn-helix domain-containing protein [Modestobacter versicolor]MBB3674381.1 AraC-like DNA-binding protein [Modestobacter versicolor]PZA23078.1 AraC family transcriptional regulator [Modestobacter versicolor]